MAIPKVFISATSADLGSVRQLVKEGLLAVGCMPIEQSSFPPDYRTLVNFLEETIKGCDAVIHIAGLCYGSEPDPSALPEGKVRRSYTQLEYDFALKLKKRTYAFVCSEDFVYDVVPYPETDDKRDLQSSHRMRLLKCGIKYEFVTDKHSVDLRTREIREHIEKIRCLMDRDRNRQLVAWIATAIILVMVSTVAWRTYEKVEFSSGQSKELLEYLREANLLGEVANAARIDRRTVEGLLLLARHSSTDPLVFAEKLDADGRKADALSLALVVGEGRLRQREPSKVREAAKAFRLAARIRHDLASLESNPTDISNGMLEASRHLQRALDSLDAVRASAASATDTFEMVALRARWMSEAGDRASLALARSIHREAFVTAAQDVLRFVGNRGLHAAASVLAAGASVTWANYLDEKVAKEALVKAVSDFDAILPILESEGRVEDWHMAVRLRTAAVRDLAARTSEKDGHILTDNARRLVESALSREEGEQFVETRDRSELNLADLLLWLAENPRSKEEENQAIAEARQRYERVFNRQAANWESYSKIRAACGLARAVCAEGDPVKARGILDQLRSIGKYHGLNATLEYARCVVAYAEHNNGYLGSVELLESCRNEIRSQLEQFPFGLAPDAYIRLRLAAAAVFNQMAYLPRATREQMDALGYASDNIRQALGELAAIEAVCPKMQAPKSWANARLQSGVYRLVFRINKGTRDLFSGMEVSVVAGYKDALKDFKDSLTVFTESEFPTPNKIAKEGIKILSRNE
jgi:hypothetical protein